MVDFSSFNIVLLPPIDLWIAVLPISKSFKSLGSIETWISGPGQDLSDVKCFSIIDTPKGIAANDV